MEEQGAIVEAIEGVSIPEYAFAFGKITDSNNLRYISKISNARISVFFSTKALADEILASRKQIKIRDRVLDIKPFAQKNKRVVISNVYPMITNEAIIQALSKQGVTLTSGITNIRAGINETGYTHLLSFRRQTYIKPEDEDRIPESLQVTYNETSHWIYLTTDTTTCFICKQKGHIARICPETISRTESNSQIDAIKPIKDNPTTNKIYSRKSMYTDIESAINQELNTEALNEASGFKIPSAPQTITPEEPHLKEMSTNRVLENITQSNSKKDQVHSQQANNKIDEKTSPLTTLPISVKKRPLSSTASSASHQDTTAATTIEVQDSQKHKQQKKKIKNTLHVDTKQSSNETPDIEAMLEPVRKTMEQLPNEYKLTFSQIKEFMVKTLNNPNIVELAKEFTNDLSTITTILRQLYPLFT